MKKDVTLNCPNCGEKMKKAPHDTYVCKNESCKDKYIVIPLSVFGIT